MTRYSFALCLLLCLLTFLPASDRPLGHADFRPSPDHPIGLLGDGTGVFPGAEPPHSWDYRTGSNIRWSRTLPSGGHGSPIVVDDNVFLSSDPDLLHCLDADTGAIRWTRRVTGLAMQTPARAMIYDRQWQDLMRFRGGIHQIMYEYYLLSYRLARIDTAKNNTVFSWHGNRHIFSITTNVSGSPALPGHLTIAEEADIDAWAQAVPAEDLASMRERRAALLKTITDKKYHSGNGYVHSHMPFRRGDGEKAFRSTAAGKRWNTRWATINRVGLVPDVWQEWLGLGWPTPASDGQHLFVTFGTGQVACYSLDGRRIWLRQFQLLDPSLRRSKAYDDRHCASPILTKTGVVVMHGHYADSALGGSYRWLNVRCLDKNTGAVLWQRRFNDRGGHDVPLHTRLRHQGIDLIVTNMGPVFRADDGRLVVDLKITCCALPSLLGDGKVLIHDAAPGGGRTRPAVVLGFTADDSTPSGVGYTIIWRVPDLGKGKDSLRAKTTHMPFFKGKVWSTDSAADPFTRKIACSWKQIRAGGFAANHIIAGEHLISVSVRGLCGVTDVSDPATPQHRGSGLIGSDRMRRFLKDMQHSAESVRPELDKGILLTNYHRLASANPWAQGKRLYIRSMDTVYCIEDQGKTVQPEKDKR